MVALSKFRIDSAAVASGSWVTVDGYQGLRIKSRGFTDEFVDARTRRLAIACKENRCQLDELPNAARRQVNAGLTADFLILDVDGLFHDDDEKQPVTVDEFKAMLANPDWNYLQRAVWDAAGQVSKDAEGQSADAVGN